MTDEQFETQFNELVVGLAECRKMLNEIGAMVTKDHAMLIKADNAITTISDQVNPLIEDIRTGGVMKLLSGGLGKKK